MYKPLFTNIVMVPQKRKDRSISKNLKNVLKWDSDIALAEVQSEGLK